MSLTSSNFFDSFHEEHGMGMGLSWLPESTDLSFPNDDLEGFGITLNVDSEMKLTSSNFPLIPLPDHTEDPSVPSVDADADDPEASVELDAEPSSSASASESSSGSQGKLRVPAVTLKSHRHVEPHAPKVVRSVLDGQVKYARTRLSLFTALLTLLARQSRSRSAAQQFRARQKEHVLELEERIRVLEAYHHKIRLQAAALRKENDLLTLRQRYLREIVFKALITAFPPRSAAHSDSAPTYAQQPRQQSQPHKAQKVY